MKAEDYDWSEISKIRHLYFFEVHWEIYENDTSYPSRKGSLKTKDYDSGVELYRTCLEAMSDTNPFRIYLVCTMPGVESWVAEHCSWKQRVAPPGHNLFFSIGGRDCDGFIWRDYYSFGSIEEAYQTIEDILASADGPCGYSTMSFEEFEQAEYPEYRDYFAEMAGY